MDILEKLEKLYNEYLIDYTNSNISIYDTDMQSTRNKIEKILLQGFIDYKDIPFLKSILSEIESNDIRYEIENFIQTMEQEI